MNKLLLKYKMALHGDTNYSLSKVLGISAVTLSYKMNERHGAQFRQGEIVKIAERYHLSPQEICEIFFTL